MYIYHNICSVIIVNTRITAFFVDYMSTLFYTIYCIYLMSINYALVRVRCKYNMIYYIYTNPDVLFMHNTVLCAVLFPRVKEHYAALRQILKSHPFYSRQYYTYSSYTHQNKINFFPRIHFLKRNHLILFGIHSYGK